MIKNRNETHQTIKNPLAKSPVIAINVNFPTWVFPLIPFMNLEFGFLKNRRLWFNAIGLSSNYTISPSSIFLVGEENFGQETLTGQRAPLVKEPLQKPL